jgi:hypothetical protein
VTSQCPSKKHGPLRRTKCGRRERESRREGRREQSLRDNDSFACRDGQRHPGFLEGGTLRGASSERRPRLVRFECSGSLLQASAPATADVRRAPRRGTPSACATKRMHPSRAREIVASEQGTRPSLGPSTRARQSSLRSRGATLVRWGVKVGITVGQTHASERNHHWGRQGRTERGSPRTTASARERAWFVRKGRRSRPSSLRGSWGAQVWLPARR